MVQQIDPTPSIPPPLATAAQSGQGERRASSQVFARRTPPVDVATVLSLPETVLPAEIQDSFLALVEEVERLREDLERARLHERYLEQAAQRHVTLPLLQRGAFMAALGRLLETSEREDLPGSLLLLHVGGLEALRREQGLAAGDALLATFADTILAHLRQTDLFGSLDSSDFAIALAVAAPQGTAAKREQILAALATAMPVMQVGSGMIQFSAGLTAATAIAAADSARLDLSIRR